jgi:biopolymer transport protein ExbD
MAGSSSSGSYNDEGDSAITDINVTPLVDVMLVLLIIFIATAPLIANRGIKANLPSTEAGGKIENKLKVTIDEDKKLFIDDREFTDAEGEIDRDGATAYLRQKHAENNQIQATIVADKTVPYGNIMDVIDLIKKAKISKFALASNPKSLETQEE